MARQQLINGKAYDWSSVTINVSGMENIEVTDISYGDKRDVEAIYGKGGRIRGYGTGNYSNDVSLSMEREDFDEMGRVMMANGYREFYKFVIPKIVISYADEGARTVTDVLTNVVLSERSVKAAQGDKSLKADLKGMAIGGITFNGLGA